MSIKKQILCIWGTACTSSLFALNALDVASNYTDWSSGSNQGSGFANWSLSENNNPSANTFAGHFLGDSSDGAGNINTNGTSFGMYANPGGAFSTTVRSFTSALSTNDQFSFKLALNFDNGNKGFNLRTGGDSIFNFNVGNGASVASANATLIAGTGLGYNYGGNDAVIDVVLLITSATSLDYQIARTSSQGFQGVLFSGRVSGITGSIDNFEFYVSDTDNGAAQNNLYYNDLQVRVVPEPSIYGLLTGVATLLWIGFSRQALRSSCHL